MSLSQHNDNLPDVEARALVLYQKKAVALLKKIGLPTRYHEQWRASKMTVFQDNNFPIAEKFYLDAVEPTLFDKSHVTKIVFVNGYFAENLSDSLPEGVSFISLAEAVSNQDVSLGLIGTIKAPYDQGYVHLNAVMCRDGAILKVAHHAHIEKPIHLVFKNITPKTISYSRTLIILEAGAKADIISEHLVTEGQHENHVMEAYVGDNATLSYLKTATGFDVSVHIGAVSAELGRDATMNVGYYMTGGDVCRTETNIYLQSEGANVNLGAASYVKGDLSNDHVSTVIHSAPYCTSSQVFQSLCDERGRCVTQSKTIVARDAQKTDGKQMLRAMLMSEEANVFAKPELEIYADDVKCTHGSTVGRLNEEAIYYMRSRGIAETEAKALLTEAFMLEALSVIGNDMMIQPLLDDFQRRIRYSPPKES